MTAAATDLKLDISRTIPAPRERVFDAWLDPKMLARFMTPGANMSVPSVETDPRVGGRFSIVMRIDGVGDKPHEGTYKVIDRAEHLAFTWESWHSTVEGSTVDLTFTEVPEGTLLRLVHTRFENEDKLRAHKGGWTAILNELAETV